MATAATKIPNVFSGLVPDFDDVGAPSLLASRRTFLTMICKPMNTSTAAPIRLSAVEAEANSPETAEPTTKVTKAYVASTDAAPRAAAAPWRQPRSMAALIIMIPIGPRGMANAKPAVKPMAKSSFIFQNYQRGRM